MTSEFSIHVNSEALIERGYNFLMIKDYQRAYDFFDRALDIDAKAHTAYWGMMLAERQCNKSDGSDLIKIGICIDTDQNYRFACQYADDAERENYENTARMCERMCHIMLIGLICEKRWRPAQLRAKHYAKSSLANKRLIDIHNSLLRKNAMTDFTRETPGALISLLEMYQDDDTFSELDRELHFFDKVKDLYREYMNRLLQEIVFYKTPYQKAKEEFEKKYKTNDNTERKNTTTLPNFAYDGSFYSDLTYYRETRKLAALMFEENNLYSYWLPYEETKKEPTEQEINAQLWVKPCEQNSIFIGSDGKPSNVGDRWRYLANYLPTTEGAKNTRAFTLMILGFYDKAVEFGSEYDLCQREKQAFFDTSVSKMTSYETIRSIRNAVPDKRRADCRIIELVLSGQEKSFSNLKRETDEKYKDAEYLIERHRRIPKQKAEWLQYMIKKSIDKLEERTKQFQKELNNNRKAAKESLQALSETVATDDEEYKNWSKEANRVDTMIADEVKRYKDFILQLREYYAVLSDRSRKPFVRYIELN